MANSNSQRVAAFLLAFLFLLTTIGTAAYVVWQLNSGDAGIVEETTTNEVQDQAQETGESAVGTIIDPFEGPYDIAELRFEDVVEGEGAEVQPGDTVTIDYVGALNETGVIFDSSVARGEPATFPLSNLIQGWQEGIPGMKVGGERRLFIPAELGYGEAGSGENIPPNSDLIFDIELFDTQSTQ